MAKTLKEFLNTQIKEEIESFDTIEDDILLEEAMNLLADIIDYVDFNNLPEDLQNRYIELFDYFDELDDEEELEEEVGKVKKRISPEEKRKHAMYYKKNKNKIKMAQKKYRKTASYKKWEKKYERTSKLGKTTTGKRQTDYK